jgi:AraC-like DNA-binding protein
VENLLIPGLFMSVLLSGLLLTKRDKRCADYVLSTFLAISALTLALAYLEIYNRDHGYIFPFFINLSPPFVLLLGPALWLYVKCLTIPDFAINRRHLLLLIPFVTVFVLFLLNDYIKPDASRIDIDSHEGFKKGYMFPLVMGLIALSNIGYTIWGLLMIKSYREKMKSFYSGSRHLELRWLRFLLVFSLIAYSVISALYAVDSALHLMPFNTIQAIGYSIASTFIIIIGFFGLNQGDLFSSVPVAYKEIEVETKITLAGVSKPDQEFVAQLLQYMKEKKPYLSPELSLETLSNCLKVTAEYLSGVLNGSLNMNFYDFINHYRIEEFKSLCKDPAKRKLTIIALAMDSGFNSKATFNRVFKKNTGLTPSEYFSKVSIN